MTPYRFGHLPRFILSLFFLSLVFIFFAPIQLGGQMAFIIVSGISMEPNLHRGDLVILHRAVGYQLGDVAAYHHPDIGVVVHRIVGLEEDRYIFKGDNNPWQDSYFPSNAEILGKKWLYLPSVGTWIDRFRQPPFLGLITILLGIAVAVTVVQPKKALDQKPNMQPSTRESGAFHHPGTMNSFEQLALLGILTLAALIACFILFRQPVKRSVQENLTYQHLGEFSYTASNVAGIYDGEAVQTGEPVFTRLNCAVNVKFDYHLDAPLPHQVRGAYRMDAEIYDDSGWKRTIHIAPNTIFVGDSAAVQGKLDLCQLLKLIDQVSQQTLVRQQSYGVDLLPEITLSGTVTGKELNDRFTPKLRFQLDPFRFQMARDGGPLDSALKPVKNGVLLGTREESNAVSILGSAIPVAPARWAAILVLLFSLSGTVLIGLPLFRAWQRGEAARVQILYQPLMIEVKERSSWSEESVVDMLRMLDLVHLAEKYGSQIFHETSETQHTYWAQNGKTVYRFTLPILSEFTNTQE